MIEHFFLTAASIAFGSSLPDPQSFAVYTWSFGPNTCPRSLLHSSREIRFRAMLLHLRFAPLVPPAAVGIPHPLYLDGRVGIYPASLCNAFSLPVGHVAAQSPN